MEGGMWAQQKNNVQTHNHGRYQVFWHSRQSVSGVPQTQRAVPPSHSHHCSGASGFGAAVAWEKKEGAALFGWVTSSCRVLQSQAEQYLISTLTILLAWKRAVSREEEGCPEAPSKACALGNCLSHLYGHAGPTITNSGMLYHLKVIKV